ncbi:hemicentin-2-like [Anopheles bellator]|uniref:hemicentin-2-like n=1 Tax=Anopheles bellator TaxID=139047 RepID=UPI002648D6B0|nr:hemicentin-2-like [Anopheles bellator]
METRIGLLGLFFYYFVVISTVLNIISGEVQSYWEQPFSQPYFDNSTKREVTATVGQSALLHCRVRNLGDRAVSWIRKRDLHILTVGILTYTNDQRFQSLHTEGSDEWTLRITSPQPRDSGTYECQVSTEPKISQAFRLNVVVSKAKILGNSELFIKSGSDINLTCVALQSPAPPSFIYWYKGGRVVNYSQRGGISVLTERQTKTSKLVIARAMPADSGNYTCSPSSSDSASVVVHVINGEQPAAMQHGNSSANSVLINNRSFGRFRGCCTWAGLPAELAGLWAAYVSGSKNVILSLTSSWVSCWLLKSAIGLPTPGR